MAPVHRAISDESVGCRLAPSARPALLTSGEELIQIPSGPFPSSVDGQPLASQVELTLTVAASAIKNSPILRS